MRAAICKGQKQSAEHVRKPAVGASARPAAPAGVGVVKGGAAADPAGGLLPGAGAREIQSMILETEQVAATGGHVSLSCGTTLKLLSPIYPESFFMRPIYVGVKKMC